MTSVCAYWRPVSLTEALTFLVSRRDAVVLGGGTRRGAGPAGPAEVVDLQALRLDRIEVTGRTTARIGAMATLARIADHPWLPDVVRDAARRERPGALRAQSTLGGCVASREPDSELLTALLAYDAVVTVAGHDGTGGPGTSARCSLAGLLAGPRLPRTMILTAVAFPLAGRASAARAGRTRADRPIVTAVARVTPDGGRRLALAGVARAPVLAGDAAGLDPGRLDLSWLHPPGDFRGCAEYRRELAAVLAGRALREVLGVRDEGAASLCSLSHSCSTDSGYRRAATPGSRC